MGRIRDRQWDFVSSIQIPVLVEFGSSGWTDLNHDGSVTLDEAYEKVDIYKVEIGDVPLLYEEIEPIRKALLRALKDEIENAIIDHMEDS